MSPALGDFLDIADYREQYRIARDIPSRQHMFKTLYLNMPSDESERWIRHDRWKACEEKFDPADLEGCECYGGLDLAPVNDLSSLTLVFPVEGKLKVLSYSWCSAEDIVTRSEDEKVPYTIWADKRHGHIITTPGNATDFKTIQRDIVELSTRYRIKTLAADKTHAYETGQALQEAGIDIRWFGQGFISMGPPTARTEKLVLERTLVHPGNPVLDYCVNNVRCETDAAGNQKPSNRLRLRHEKIDAAVALIMAVGVWMDTLVQKQGSVYDKQGVIVI